MSRNKNKRSAERRGTDTSGLAAASESGVFAAIALRNWLFAFGLAIVVFAVYQPAWHGGVLWDDNAHMTHPELRSWQGLARIWYDVGATQQYYPLLHSFFWMQHALWGDDTLGYHWTNLALHTISAILVMRVLRRLKIPGAYLAAAIFALHPVQVESVAWITEQKNTLSTVFYLGAMLCYLRFDDTRQRSWYGAALAVFVLSLLSKTVTATLPAALLVIFWWQRGRLSWKTDVLPLLPMFALGIAAGLFTAWVERTLIGAEGSRFSFSVLERCLIAGRVAWFYLGKLLWPAELIFIYPRWQIDSNVWWQYLFPLAVIALLFVLWSLRHRTRAPLAAVLFFGGTLAPVLGFLNVFPFIYSFVADHFQYVASLGIIVLFSAAVAVFIARLKDRQLKVARAASVLLLAVLAVLSWRQSQMYASVDSLYQTILERNPSCLMAHTNYGNILAQRGKRSEAIAHFQSALEIDPNYVDARNNLGLAFFNSGRQEDAIKEYERALSVDPGHVDTLNNLGIALVKSGRVEEGLDRFKKAIKIRPNSVDMVTNLGFALVNQGKAEQAIALFTSVLKINPKLADGYYGLGLALAARGSTAEALTQYQKAVELNPNFAEARTNLGVALAASGRLDEAIKEYRKVIEFKPDHVEAYNNLGSALTEQKKFEEAVGQFKTALRLKPDLLETHYNLAAVLMNLGRKAEALDEFRRAHSLAVLRKDGNLVEMIGQTIRGVEGAQK